MYHNFNIEFKFNYANIYKIANDTSFLVWLVFANALLS